MEFYSCSLSDIKKGEFPLNHDCILKVCYFPGSGISFEFFTCRAPDSGELSVILSQLSIVNKVVPYSVDNFYL